jgi:hypothetical protein
MKKIGMILVVAFAAGSSTRKCSLRFLLLGCQRRVQVSVNRNPVETIDKTHLNHRRPLLFFAALSSSSIVVPTKHHV